MRRVTAPLAVLLLLVSACSSSGSGSPTADPAVAFCAALDDYSKSLLALEALTSSSTLVEYKTAVDDAKSKLAALVAVSGPFVGAQLNEAQSAQTNLTAAAAELPVGATPAEAETELQPYLDALVKEVAGVHNATCNFRPTVSPGS